MVGILIIGSYVYHSDVIVTSTQIYVNRVQIHSSMLCRFWGVQDKNTNTMMIPTLYS